MKVIAGLMLGLACCSVNAQTVTGRLMFSSHDDLYNQVNTASLMVDEASAKRLGMDVFSIIDLTSTGGLTEASFGGTSTQIVRFRAGDEFCSWSSDDSVLVLSDVQLASRSPLRYKANVRDVRVNRKDVQFYCSGE